MFLSNVGKGTKLRQFSAFAENGCRKRRPIKLWSGQGAMAPFGFEREPVFIEEEASPLTEEVVTSTATSCRPGASAKPIVIAVWQVMSFGTKVLFIYATKHQKTQAI